MKRIEAPSKGNEIVSPANIRAFETEHGIALPERYRKALMTIGVGGHPHRLSTLEDWCQPNSPDEMPEGFLRMPFPHRSMWNDLSQRSGGWDSPYYNALHWAGAMRIVNAGCELYYLLVVSGPERSTVWYDGTVDGLGIVPLLGRKGDHASFDDFLNGDCRISVES